MLNQSIPNQSMPSQHMPQPNPNQHHGSHMHSQQLRSPEAITSLSANLLRRLHRGITQVQVQVQVRGLIQDLVQDLGLIRVPGLGISPSTQAQSFQPPFPSQTTRPPSRR